ncbi:MAG: hypothetical protein K5683_02280 [Prevotella sp.]|nr:hypothetical protein [Prevotella sp.]
MTTSENTPTRSYRTLADISQRKQELRMQLLNDKQHIDQLWKGLFVKREESTRGQFIANIISNSAMAIDAFLMVRKLKKNYSGLFQFFKKKKKNKE